MTVFRVGMLAREGEMGKKGVGVCNGLIIANGYRLLWTKMEVIS